MKIKTYILALFIILTFSNCNQAKKDKLPLADKRIATTTKNEHPILTPADSLKLINHTITVTGEIEFPLKLSVDSLKKMKVVTIHNFKVVCESGATKKEDKKAKGVLLKDILKKAKIKQLDHKDRNFYIVARASDNYKATFSWAELFNNATGDNVYILFEENGKPLKDGEMILISRTDTKTGPRHVKWLKSVEVYKVN